MNDEPSRTSRNVNICFISYLFILCYGLLSWGITPIYAFGWFQEDMKVSILNYLRSLKEWLVSDEEVKLIGVVLCPCIAYLLPPSIYICPGWWLEIHPKMWLMRVKTGIEIDPQPSARIIRYYIDWFGWKHSLEYQAFYCGSDEF